MIFDEINLEIVRWLVIIFLGGWGIFIIVMNYVILFHNMMPNAKWSSAGPFLGGLFTAIGIGLLPYPEVSRYWYVSFLVDYTYMMFIWYLVFYSWREGGLFARRGGIFDRNSCKTTIYFPCGCPIDDCCHKFGEECPRSAREPENEESKGQL